MMPVVNVNLVLDDETYDAVVSGTYKLCGMVKDPNTHRIIKHVPTVIDSTKESAAKAIDIIRANKNTLIGIGIVLGVAGVGGAIYGFATHQKNKAKKALQSAFAENMQAYLDAARSGTLSEDILLSFITSMDELSIHGKKADINIPLVQINELISSIYDFTIQIAIARGKDTKTIDKPFAYIKDNFSNLQYYLGVQRNIIIEAA